MKFIVKLAFLVAGNALAIFIASKFIPGISLEVTLMNLIKVGALLGLVNAVVKPILKLFSLPLIILTLGLFVVIINAVSLLLVSWVFDFLHINGFLAAIGGVIVISIVNFIISFFVKD